MQSLAIARTYGIWVLRESVFFLLFQNIWKQKNKHSFGEAVTTETIPALIYLFLKGIF